MELAGVEADGVLERVYRGTKTQNQDLKSTLQRQKL